MILFRTQFMDEADLLAEMEEEGSLDIRSVKEKNLVFEHVTL